MDTLQPTLLATLLGLFCLVLVRVGRVPQLSGAALLKGGAFAALLVALAFSDYPASWRLADLMAYLAEVTLAPFRVLLVIVIGAALFGGMLGLLYLVGRGRRPRGRDLALRREQE
ncbi:hypothetical protein [Truepera radiovictrix]|uniref:Uncharacterized protein n=1 Tax=Truepera radiovictrix (strain DSM 17093 / CIP 108686 / LMG 22925 / RQ-24) TaxID=649638 RepID=D7CWM8_TRURR|nr:hypothetical protein [Truepera radiovictrix]ADI14427.1 hypothetical protein Trad_1305 [Truepera radiovictrix DSM 17093]WMT57016.1 hypothetical protein RCV51_13480 [Truepera radiovictrix]